MALLQQSNPEMNKAVPKRYGFFYVILFILIHKHISHSSVIVIEHLA